MPKLNAEMTDAVNVHAAAKALHLHHHHARINVMIHVKINVRIHVMNAPNLHKWLHINPQYNTLHQLHQFQFHNHQDAALVSIETATSNAFQM